jgi:ABC-2 type transport system ATP-binding protein
MIVVETVNLSKHYADILALDDVNLRLHAGELLYLLGPNGAGKTTLLNVLLGLVPPTGGRALVAGVDVVAQPEHARRATAYIPELVTLYPTLSGIENLRFFSELAGHRLYSNQDYERFLAEAGLDPADARRRVSTYSKGMRQKVGIAIAVAKQAQLLLLDEPTSGLDPAAANEFMTSLAAMSARGCAVLMTTHDLFRAKASGARVGIMRRGRLVASFDSASVDSSQLEQAYLGAIQG